MDVTVSMALKGKTMESADEGLGKGPGRRPEFTASFCAGGFRCDDLKLNLNHSYLKE